MSSTIVVTIGELVLESLDDFSNVTLTLQLQEASYSFLYPFENISIPVEKLDSDDILLAFFSTSSEDLGYGQLSLADFQSIYEFEKTVIIARLAASPDKGKPFQQKLSSTGKLKVHLKLEKTLSQDSETANSMAAIKQALEFVLSIVGDVWKLEVPKNSSLEELGLAMFASPDSKRVLDKNDLEHFRLLLLGLNEKLKLLPLMEARLKETEERSEKYLKMYEHLQRLIGKIEEKYEDERRIQEKNVEDLLRQKNSLMLELQSAKSKIAQLEDVVDGYQRTQAEVHARENLGAWGERWRNSYEELFKKQRQEINMLQDKEKELIRYDEELLKETDSISSKYLAEIDILHNENQALLSKYSILQSAFTEKSELFDSKISEIRSLSSQLECSQHENAAFKDLESRFALSEQRFASLADQFQDLQIESSKTLCNFTSIKSKFEEEKDLLLQHAKELQDENMKLQSSLIKQLADSNKLTADREELALKSISLEQALANKEDMHSIKQEVEVLKELNKVLNENVYKELEFMSEYLLGQSEHNLSNIRAMNKIKSVAEDKEAEIGILRDMVTELQRIRVLYIPIRDDPIDGALADYVNTRGSEVPFTREDHGIYLFGSKRVFIRIEHGRIIIRVGGGYMKIEDFLEVYTPLELEKMEIKRKEEANGQRNAILIKLAGNIANDKTKGRTEISPEKARKIIKEAMMKTPKFIQCFGVTKSSPRKTMTASRSPTREKVRSAIRDDTM